MRVNASAGGLDETEVAAVVATETSSFLNESQVDARVSLLAPALADARVLAGTRRGTQALSFSGVADALTASLTLGYGQKCNASGAPSSSATITGLETLPDGESAMLELTLAAGKSIAISGVAVSLLQLNGDSALADVVGDGTVWSIFMSRVGNAVKYTAVNEPA